MLSRRTCRMWQENTHAGHRIRSRKVSEEKREREREREIMIVAREKERKILLCRD
jgi:hypothetical protein